MLFWISTRTAPGPISQVLPGCQVRHPQYSKKLFVRIWPFLGQVSVLLRLVCHVSDPGRRHRTMSLRSPPFGSLSSWLGDTETHIQTMSLCGPLFGSISFWLGDKASEKQIQTVPLLGPLFGSLSPWPGDNETVFL